MAPETLEDVDGGAQTAKAVLADGSPVGPSRDRPGIVDQAACEPGTIVFRRPVQWHRRPRPDQLNTARRFARSRRAGGDRYARSPRGRRDFVTNSNGAFFAPFLLPVEVTVPKRIGDCA